MAVRQALTPWQGYLRRQAGAGTSGLELTTEHTGRSVQEAAAVSDELACQAAQLNALVGRFRG